VPHVRVVTIRGTSLGVFTANFRATPISLDKTVGVIIVEKSPAVRQIARMAGWSAHTLNGGDKMEPSGNGKRL
jgi:hypothetical protein